MDVVSALVHESGNEELMVLPWSRRLALLVSLSSVLYIIVKYVDMMLKLDELVYIRYMLADECVRLLLS